MRGKRTASVLCMLMACLSLMAGEIKGTGWGMTRDEAVASARKDLAGGVSADIISYQILSVNLAGSSGENFESVIFQSSSFTLMGAQTTVRQEDGGYTATIRIPESAATMYATKVRELARETNTLYSKILSMKGGTDINLLRQLRELTADFSTCRAVLQILSPGSPEASRMTDVSFSMADVMYRERLIRDMNAEEMTISDLDRRIRLGLAEEGAERILSESRERYESMKAEKERIAAERSDERRKRLEELEGIALTGISLISSGAGMTDVSVSDKASSMINEIESGRRTAHTLREGLTEKLNVMVSEAYDERKRISAEIESIPYDDTDFLNGHLTDEAVAWRNFQTEKAVREIMEAYRISGSELAVHYITAISGIYSEMAELISNLNGKTFTYRTDSPGTAVSYDSLSMDTGRIEGTVRTVIGNGTVSFSFTLDYGLLTGKSRPSMQDDDYGKYREEMAAIFGVLKNCPEAYPVEIEIRIRGDGSPKYSCSLVSCRLYGWNGSSGALKCTFFSGQEPVMVYDGGEGPIGDYSWLAPYHDIVDADALAPLMAKPEILNVWPSAASSSGHRNKPIRIDTELFYSLATDFGASFMWTAGNRDDFTAGMTGALEIRTGFFRHEARISLGWMPGIKVLDRKTGKTEAGFSAGAEYRLKYGISFNDLVIVCISAGPGVWLRDTGEKAVLSWSAGSSLSVFLGFPDSAGIRISGEILFDRHHGLRYGCTVSLCTMYM